MRTGIVGGVALAGALGVFIVGCGGGAPDAAAPAPSAEQSAAPVAKAPPPPPPAAKAPVCSDPCKQALSAGFEKLKRADGLAEAPKAGELYSKAGESLERAWRTCLLAGPKAADAGCENADRVVVEMSRAYGKSGKTDKAVTAHLVVLDPRWNVPEAGQADARKQLEMIVADPKGDPAARALAHSALGDASAAETAAKKLRLPHIKSPMKAEVILGVASHLIEAGETKRAQSLLTPNTRPESAGGQIAWHAAKARIALESRLPSAAREANAALKLWTAATDKQPVLGGIAPRPLLGREQVIDSLGSAHFVLAQLLGQQAAKAKAPSYYGKADNDSVEKFIKEKVNPWVVARQEKIVAAQTAYAEIAKLQPVAPARWVAAGFSNLAELWSTFAADAVALADAAALKKDPELAANLKKQLEKMTAPMAQSGKDAAASCKKVADAAALPAKVCEKP